MKKTLFFSLLIFILFPLAGLCFDITTKAWKQPEGILINVHYQTFPFQRLLLALKEQKFPVYIKYTFRIYKKKFFWKDKLLKEVSTKITLFYEPAENFYILKRANQAFKFAHPEDLLKYLLQMNSFFVPFVVNSYNQQQLYIDETITIELNTAFSEDLRRESNFKRVLLTAHAQSKIF